MNNHGPDPNAAVGPTSGRLSLLNSAHKTVKIQSGGDYAAIPKPMSIRQSVGVIDTRGGAPLIETGTEQTERLPVRNSMDRIEPIT